MPAKHFAPPSLSRAGNHLHFPDVPWRETGTARGFPASAPRPAPPGSFHYRSPFVGFSFLFVCLFFPQPETKIPVEIRTTALHSERGPPGSGFRTKSARGAAGSHSGTNAKGYGMGLLSPASLGGQRGLRDRYRENGREPGRTLRCPPWCGILGGRKVFCEASRGPEGTGGDSPTPNVPGLPSIGV